MKGTLYCILACALGFLGGLLLKPYNIPLLNLIGIVGSLYLSGFLMCLSNRG